MKIDVPDEIVEEFYILLDLAQASVTLDADLSEKEKQCLKWVRNTLLRPLASEPWKSGKEKQETAKEFKRATGL